MDTRPASLPESLYLSPRYLVTSTRADHADHLAAFAGTSGWTRTQDGATTDITSPCGRITLRQDDDVPVRRPHLTITGRSGPGAPERWRVAVSGFMPVEFVSALTDTLANGLENDPDALVYGVGAGDEAIMALDEEVWMPFNEGGLVGFHSQDYHAIVAGRPKGSPAPPMEGDESVCWKVGAVVSTETAERLWTATFTYSIPSHLVAGLVNEVARFEPLLRPITSTLDLRVAPLVRYWPVETATPPRTPRSADTRSTPPRPAAGEDPGRHAPRGR
ncbi:protein of unknown function DUF317 [Actinobacteria bacterium OK074]|nr:protein of unknown function DUF317 [Actinobacteria bacterium OK074]